MGIIIVKNIERMNWKVRVSLIAMFTLVLSGLIYHGWRQSYDALAAVATGTAWTNVHAAAPGSSMNSNTDYSTTSTGTFTAGAGNNRLLLVAVYYEFGTASTGTFSATFGGTAVTQIASTGGASGREHIWLGYVKNASIPTSASTVRATYRTSSSNTLSSISIKVGTYNNVDQNSPIIGSNAALSSGTSVSNSGTVSYANGGMTVLTMSNGGTSVTPSVSATPSMSVVSSATNTSNHATYVYQSAVHASASSYSSGGIATSYSGSPSSRSALAVASLRPATTTLGNGVAGTTGNAAPGASAQKLDGFSLTTGSTGTTDTVTGLTVTTTNQAAIASMQIWNEAGTTQYFSTVNNPGSNTWSFSGGTAIPVTSTAANYKILVTYKTRAVGAPAGNTATTAYVSALACSNTTAGTDTADTTLTLLNTHAASTWGSNTAGSGQITLNWTYGTPGQSVIIIRYTATTNTTKPTDGQTYGVGSAFGTGGTVRYNGAAATFTDTVGLTNGTTYYYKIFEYDTYTNYYNASDVWTAGLTPTSPDSVPPTVDAGFAATTPVNSINVPISSFGATDNVGGSGVAGYLITTSSTKPSAGDAGWTTTPPATFNAGAAGTYTLYPWAKDGGGTVSNAYASPVTVVVDQTKPAVSTFTVTTPVTSRTIPVTAFTGSDSGGSGVAGYIITTSSTAPSAGAAGWISPAPASFAVAADGTFTLYPWIKDAAGNVSAAFASPRTVLVDTTPPAGLTLVSPADEATGIAVNVALQCSAASDSSGPVMYWFQISNDSNYSQNSGWISGTSFTPTGLQQGLNYIWSVKAKDSLGNETAFTTPRTFTTTAPCVRNDPTLTLLTGSGGIASTITTDGGTAAYNVKIINNDFGNCGSSTFNLSVNDTDLLDHFDSPMLGAASVTLIPGAQTTTTMTVKGTPGEDSGVAKDSVTSAGDAYHGAVTTGQVQTTLNVANCIAKTPLLIVGPASGYVNKGGTLVYTVTVKNSDTGALCSAVDFNIGKSENNSTDFNPSQLSTTTLRLNPGALGSATLTVSAKSTAAKDARNQATLSLAATGHTAPANVAVTSIVNNPMLHNSDNTGSGKWGGWGVPGKRYGEFTCETCHVGGGGDTSNVKRINEKIFTPYTSTHQHLPGEGQLIAYRRYVGTSPSQPVLGWDSAPATPRPNGSSPARICEVCHTYDATGANGTKVHPFKTTATLGNHVGADGRDCTSCHKHSKGFGAAGTCTTCHGDSAVTTYDSTTRYIVAPPVNAAGATGTLTGVGLVSNDRKVGAHQTHLRFFNGFSNYSTIDYRCQGCHGSLPTDSSHASVSGSALPKFEGLATKWNARTPTYSSTNLTCSNTYCHNPAGTGGTLRATNAGSNVFPSWTSARYVADGTKTQSNCNVCHKVPGDAGFEPAGTHNNMTIATDCSGCHGHNGDATGTVAGKRHLDGYMFGAGNCDSCHGYDVGTWASQPERSGVPEGKGAHEKHIAYLKTRYSVALNPTSDAFGGTGNSWTFVCGVCHNGASHNMAEAIPGTGRTISIIPARQIGPDAPLYNGTPGISSSVAGKAKTCSNVDCHYKESPVWSSY